eukprot:TRINITY_DN7467_c0_g1_i1.p1 TRINITY_DN7467_c0_g1~~TRINITY_DN7467_c0_g1_i1.p1  ORF type:complete len:399 (-),score=75.69 TRINITY_DN7467_c0_g1_i1:108-1304(-)
MGPAVREGDWQCVNTACINHQFPQNFVFAAKVNCPKCGTGKFAQRAGDWCCPNESCVNHKNTVYGSKSNCQRCGSAKPVVAAGGGMAGGGKGGAAFGNMGLAPASAPYPGGMPMQMQGGGAPQPRQGDWHCPTQGCKNHVDQGNVIFGKKTACPLCGTGKPANPRLPATGGFQSPGFQAGGFQAGGFQAGGYQGGGFQGGGGFFPATPFQPPPPMAPHPQMMGMGGHHQPPPPMMPHPQAGAQAWGPNPNAPPGAASRARPGDWHCSTPGCKNQRDNVIYADKTACPICGAQKGVEKSTSYQQLNPNAPAGAASRARPGDWHCSTPDCKNSQQNVIYASKSACLLCGCPRDQGFEAAQPVPAQGMGSANPWLPMGHGKGNGRGKGPAGEHRSTPYGMS